eukprot:scaffold8072_cov2702-Prasinococcus_capsulatus_cf.AAC.1
MRRSVHSPEASLRKYTFPRSSLRWSAAFALAIPPPLQGPHWMLHTTMPCALFSAASESSPPLAAA